MHREKYAVMSACIGRHFLNGFGVVYPFGEIVVQKTFDFFNRGSHAERIEIVRFLFIIYVNYSPMRAGLVGRIGVAYEK